MYLGLQTLAMAPWPETQDNLQTGIEYLIRAPSVRAIRHKRQLIGGWQVSSSSQSSHLLLKTERRGSKGSPLLHLAILRTRYGQGQGQLTRTWNFGRFTRSTSAPDGQWLAKQRVSSVEICCTDLSTQPRSRWFSHAACLMKSHQVGCHHAARRNKPRTLGTMPHNQDNLRRG